MINAALLAFLTSLLTTWAMRACAPRLKAIAERDPYVVTHLAPTPLLGGIGVFAGLSSGLASQFSPEAAAFLVVLLPLSFLGFAKDSYAKNLGPLPQIVVEILAGAAIVAWIFGPAFALTWIGAACTIFIAGFVNATNFLDVSDGLAGSVSAFVCLSLAIAAHLNALPLLSLHAIVLACAIAGFLVWNRPKASIFMGDTGSFMIGGAVAVMVLQAWRDGVPILVLLLICAVPLGELALTTVMRLATGRSPFRGDSSHLSLRLLSQGASQWSILALYMGATATTCLLGFAVLYSWHL